MTDKWNGVERLADAIQENWIGGGSAYTIAEAAEKVLRKRLEPLLEAAWEVVELHLPTDCRDSSICERCELRRKVATWR